MKIYITRQKIYWNTLGQGKASEIIMSVAIGIMLIEIGRGIMFYLMK